MVIDTIQVGEEATVIPPGSFMFLGAASATAVDVIVSVFGRESHATMVWKRISSSSYSKQMAS